MCAAIFPRLATLIGAPTSGSSSLEMNAFRWPYVIASISFALLIGFGVLIWEWNVKASPRQIFLAALGLPALFAGALNSVAISSNASRLGQQLDNITDQYREANGIPVKDEHLSPISSFRPASGDIDLIQAAFGESLRSEPGIAVAQKGGVDLGIYHQKKFWVVLYTANTRNDAERKLGEFGTQYGKVSIQQLQNQYAITLASSLPYSEAVSKAVDVKRQSGNTLAPVLVPAR
jgi:hypothetical protein